MKVKLVLMRGDQRVKEIPINAEVAIIGRGAGSDIRIISHEVSRHHCRIKIRDDVVTVKDLGSANGTSVNGQQILEKEVLRHGDLLQLGSVTFRVEIEALKAIAIDEDDVPEGAVITEGVVVLEDEPVAQPDQALTAGSRVDGEENLPMADVEEEEELPLAEVEDLPMAEVEDEEEAELLDDLEVVDEEANGEPEEEKKLISLVLWLSEPRYLDSVILQRQASEAFGEEIGSDDPEAHEFVIGESPSFVIAFRGLTFLVNNFDRPYIETPEAEALAKEFKDLRMRKAILEHKGWLSVDLLGEVEPGQLPEIYRYLGKLTATLADTDCLAIYSPATNQINVYDSDLEQQLRGPNPLEVFSVMAKVPVIEIADDDPRMQAAVEEARRRWPEFVAAFKKRRTDQHFAVKAPFHDQENTEFMWATVTGIRDDVIVGVLDSDPVDIKNVALGDRVQIRLADLNDWAYTSGEEMVGGFTVAVLREIQEGE